MSEIRNLREVGAKLARAQNAIEQGNKQAMSQIGGRVIEMILTRTASGIDINSIQFKPYSTKYAKKMNKSTVDLCDTGKMFRSITKKVMTGKMVRIYVKNTEHGKIGSFGLARVHNFGLNSFKSHTPMPKREFFGLTPEEKNQIKKELKQMLNDYLKSSFK